MIVFREIIDPISGKIEDGNIEIGRIVANDRTRYIQTTISGDENDVPLLPMASAIL